MTSAAPASTDTEDWKSRALESEAERAELVATVQRLTRAHVMGLVDLPPGVFPLWQQTHQSLLHTQGRTHAGIVIPKYPHITDALFGVRGVTLLTAPYGIGKTTFTLNIARSVAEAGNCQVVYITAEMTAVRLAQRLLVDMAAPQRGEGHPITMQQLLTGDQMRTPAQREAHTNAEELHLGELQAEMYRGALEKFKALTGTKRLQIVDMKDIGSMHWSRGDGEHALTPLERHVDSITDRGSETLILLDTIAHLEVQPNGAGGEVGDYKDDLSQDRDITAGLRQWREALGEKRALIAVHEESKARTGSGEGHAIRGSSRYAYGADALIQIVEAESNRGSVALKLREPTNDDGVSQIDVIINKARDGGHSGTLIGLDHHYQSAEVREIERWTRRDIAAKAADSKSEKKSAK